tara:strand:- start:383 stop:595 length:213 start_codon:yes stop_codon:yes gene_type:complete
MTIEWGEILVAILTTSLLGLVTFVWRCSHRVALLEQNIRHLSNKVKQMEIEHDKVLDRMYSIAKERGRPQ